MAETLTIGGPVTVGGASIDFGGSASGEVSVAAQSAFVPMLPIRRVSVAAQSAFVPMLPIRRVSVAAQSAFVPMLPGPPPGTRRRCGPLIA